MSFESWGIVPSTGHVMAIIYYFPTDLERCCSCMRCSDQSREDIACFRKSRKQLSTTRRHCLVTDTHGSYTHAALVDGGLPLPNSELRLRFEHPAK